jgi:hypothetical protein
MAMAAARAAAFNSLILRSIRFSYVFDVKRKK